VQSRATFAALRQRGVRSRPRAVRVSYLPMGSDGAGDPGSERPVVRLALAIGRPVGTAVVRNRVRRRLRAAFTELAPAPGTYLLSASPAAATRSYAELRHELAAGLAEVAGSAPPT
jgi:ribonuclease P protein component